MDNGNYTYSHFEKICEVEKITPTGRIRLKGYKEQFNKYGEKMGRNTREAPCRISLLSEEMEKELREKWRKQEVIRKAVDLCHKVSENTLPYDLAVAIIHIFDGEKDGSTEKQEAKKPQKIYMSKSRYYMACPNCQQRLDREVNYCFECGQAMDWGD